MKPVNREAISASAELISVSYQRSVGGEYTQGTHLGRPYRNDHPSQFQPVRSDRKSTLWTTRVLHTDIRKHYRRRDTSQLSSSQSQRAAGARHGSTASQRSNCRTSSPCSSQDSMVPLDSCCGKQTVRFHRHRSRYCFLGTVSLVRWRESRRRTLAAHITALVLCDVPRAGLTTPALLSPLDTSESVSSGVDSIQALFDGHCTGNRQLIREDLGTLSGMKAEQRRDRPGSRWSRCSSCQTSSLYTFEY